MVLQCINFSMGGNYLAYDAPFFIGLARRGIAVLKLLGAVAFWYNPTAATPSCDEYLVDRFSCGARAAHQLAFAWSWKRTGSHQVPRPVMSIQASGPGELTQQNDVGCPWNLIAITTGQPKASKSSHGARSGAPCPSRSNLPWCTCGAPTKRRRDPGLREKGLGSYS